MSDFPDPPRLSEISGSATVSPRQESMASLVEAARPVLQGVGPTVAAKVALWEGLSRTLEQASVEGVSRGGIEHHYPRHARLPAGAANGFRVTQVGPLGYSWTLFGVLALASTLFIQPDQLHGLGALAQLPVDGPAPQAGGDVPQSAVHALARLGEDSSAALTEEQRGAAREAEESAEPPAKTARQEATPSPRGPEGPFGTRARSKARRRAPRRGQRRTTRQDSIIADTADVALVEELRLLQLARAHARSRPHKALSLIKEHELRHREGLFAQEREVIAIDALLALGRRRQAAERATAFLNLFPDSAHRRRIRALLHSPRPAGRLPAPRLP